MTSNSTPKKESRELHRLQVIWALNYDKPPTCINCSKFFCHLPGSLIPDDLDFTKKLFIYADGREIYFLNFLTKKMRRINPLTFLKIKEFNLTNCTCSGYEQ